MTYESKLPPILAGNPGGENSEFHMKLRENTLAKVYGVKTQEDLEY